MEDHQHNLHTDMWPGPRGGGGGGGGMSDLPTPKSEKTGGGPKKILEIGQKTGRFCKNVT